MRRALKPYGDVPILAAGGICTGEQMAGVMTMGADGVWCASVFLQLLKQKHLIISKEN